jgi:hypothetical protein
MVHLGIDVEVEVSGGVVGASEGDTDGEKIEGVEGAAVGDGAGSSTDNPILCGYGCHGARLGAIVLGRWRGTTGDVHGGATQASGGCWRRVVVGTVEDVSCEGAWEPPQTRYVPYIIGCDYFSVD